jgi:hypothetical protein
VAGEVSLQLYRATSRQQAAAAEFRSHAVALGGGGRQKKAEVKAVQEALSVVYVIKGQALTRATDQLQQIQSTDRM